MIQLDLSFFKSELVITYKRFVERGGKRCLRFGDGIIVLQKMIMLSADGIDFIDKKDFTEKTEAPKGTGDLVWDFCLEKEILTTNEKGFYTAKEWVEQNGFLIKDRVENSGNREVKKAKSRFVAHKVMPEDLGLDENDLKDLRALYKNPENCIIAIHLFYDWMCAKKEAGTWNPKTDIKKQLLCIDRDWAKKALNLVRWDREEYLAQINQVWGR